MTDQPDMDIQFYQIVLSLQAQAWQSLGKVASPLTGKIERNLEQAKFSIDMLEMLQRKTAGNLSDEEKSILKHALYELRMNFLEEQKKGDNTGDSESSKADEQKKPESNEKKDDKEADKSDPD